MSLQNLFRLLLIFFCRINIEQWKSNTMNHTEIANFDSNYTDSTTVEDVNSFEGWWLLPVFSDDNTIIYYSTVFVLVLATTYSRSLLFYNWALTASTRMHNWMFDNIVYSPMIFFNDNPSGRILNRFSKDIGSLDETLPMTLLDTVQVGMEQLLYITHINMICIFDQCSYFVQITFFQTLVASCVWIRNVLI